MFSQDDFMGTCTRVPRVARTLSMRDDSTEMREMKQVERKSGNINRASVYKRVDTETLDSDVL